MVAARGFAAAEEDPRDPRGSGWTDLAAAAVAKRSPPIENATDFVSGDIAAAALSSEDLVRFRGALGGGGAG